MKEYWMRCIPIYIVSVLLGIVTDLTAMSDRANQHESAFSIGFFVIVPLGAFLLSILIHLLSVRRSRPAKFLGAIVFFSLMIFSFWFYEQRRGQVSDMYGMFYLMGTIPSIVAGIIYGTVLLKRVRPPNQAL